MNYIRKTLIISIIVILLIVIVFVVVRSSNVIEVSNNQQQEQFTQKKLWKKRFQDLNKVIPLLYKRYFNKVNNIPIKSNKPSLKPNRIFISIASYRDNQCLDTVKCLSENADHPELLTIVICQQNSIFDKDCISWCDTKKHPACKQTKIERLSYISARGPTWARWRIQQKWNGEEYYLQIDAHTRMIKGWDSILKQELAMCPSSKPVLTQYPLEYDIVDKNDRRDPTKENWQIDKLRDGLRVVGFEDPDGFFRIQSNYTTERRSQPFSATCWAAGFSFSRGDFFWDVGYDPYTPFLFFGEEMDISARGWTNGWDFYSPSQTVVFHNYKRDHRKTFWENPMQWSLEILSRFRIYVRLGYLKKENIPKRFHFIFRDMDKFHIGNVRSLADYQNYCKMDISQEELVV